MAKHKVLAEYGLDYPDPKHEGAEKHAEAGLVVDDLPESSIPHLLKLKWIEPATDAPKTDTRKED